MVITETTMTIVNDDNDANIYDDDYGNDDYVDDNALWPLLLAGIYSCGDGDDVMMIMMITKELHNQFVTSKKLLTPSLNLWCRNISHLVSTILHYACTAHMYQSALLCTWLISTKPCLHTTVLSL